MPFTYNPTASGYPVPGVECDTWIAPARGEMSRPAGFTDAEGSTATGENRAIEQEGGSLRLWPYRRGTALLASVFLLVVLVLALIGLRQANALPGDRIGAWLLLGVVLLGLVPVFLSVLDLVVERGGTVEAPGGVKISFAAVEVSARVDVSRTTISGNLGGTPGVSVADTGGATILQTLKPVLGSDVAVLELGEGQEWWQTRLLLLTAGATRLGYPRVLVFTATVSGRTKQFVAWATPEELLRVHLTNASPQMQLAYQRAQALAGRYALGEPVVGGNQVILPWSVPGTPTAAATAYPPGTPPPQLIPEQFLLTQLAELEPPSPQPMTDLAVTVPLLRALFTAVLREGSVERADPDERWLSVILDGSDDYIAVTERGAYVTLVSRPAAINAVLRSLIPEVPNSAPTPGTRSGNSSS